MRQICVYAQPTARIRPLIRRMSQKLVLPAKRQAKPDRKSTRLNSSHDQISYAVFCLKKKKKYHHRPARDLQPTELAADTVCANVRNPRALTSTRAASAAELRHSGDINSRSYSPPRHQ